MAKKQTAVPEAPKQRTWKDVAMDAAQAWEDASRAYRAEQESKHLKAEEDLLVRLVRNLIGDVEPRLFLLEGSDVLCAEVDGVWFHIMHDGALTKACISAPCEDPDCIARVWSEPLDSMADLGRALNGDLWQTHQHFYAESEPEEPKLAPLAIVDDGGSFFPGIPVEEDGRADTVEGISRRNWLAGMAMQGLVSHNGHYYPDKCALAEEAYEIADAMIKAGEVRSDG